MKLLTNSILRRLIANGVKSAALTGDDDHKPAIKLFNPMGSAIWLLSEVDPKDNNFAFGLCDLGMGDPELGYVSLVELQKFRGPLGLGIERDLNWTADKTIRAYAAAARLAGRISA